MHHVYIICVKIRKPLDSFATNCYRIMLGIKQRKKTNEDVYKPILDKYQYQTKRDKSS